MTTCCNPLLKYDIVSDSLIDYNVSYLASEVVIATKRKSDTIALSCIFVEIITGSERLDSLFNIQQ